MILKENIAISNDGDSLLNAVREAVKRGATKILYDKARPAIMLQRPIEDDEFYNEASEAYYIARERDIEEMPLIENPLDFFFRASNLISERGFFISYILTGSIKNLGDWFKSDISLTNQLFGYKVLQYEEVEEDVILICASGIKIAEPVDTKFSVKGQIC